VTVDTCRLQTFERRVLLPLTVLPRPKGGVIVLCKSTYTVLAEGLAPAVTEPIRSEAERWAGGRAVRRPSELALAVGPPRLVLAGHAHAPGSRPVERLRARGRVGSIEVPIDLCCVPGQSQMPLHGAEAVAEGRAGVQPGDPIELDHLHPYFAHVRARVPSSCPMAKVVVRGREERIRLAPDIVIVDADAGTLSVLHRGELVSVSAEDTLEVTLFEIVAPEVDLAPMETLPSMPAPPSSPLPFAVPRRGPRSVAPPRGGTALDAVDPSIAGALAARVDLALDVDDLAKHAGLERADVATCIDQAHRRARQSLRRGAESLRDRLDDAYVDEMERLRGPVTPEAFARAVDATRRDACAEVARELGWPEAAVPRIVRVGFRRIASHGVAAAV
jgi:hypothetical protein